MTGEMLGQYPVEVIDRIIGDRKPAPPRPIAFPEPAAAPGPVEELPFSDRPGDPDLVTLADVEPTRVRWLWPGYVPLAKVTILDGDPGLGKSTIMPM